MPAISGQLPRWIIVKGAVQDLRQKRWCMKKLFEICLIAGLIVGIACHGFAGEGDWRQEYDRICAHKVEASKLSVEELTRLIDESDKLMEVIKSKDDYDVKLYIIRLKQCRGFFDYMREYATMNK